MPKFLDDVIVHGGAKAVINNATNASGAALHVGNVNAGNWNDGIVIDDPSGWAAVVYKRNNAAKMFTGLYNGTDNYIMMSSGYSNTGTAITAPRSDAVMRILPGSDTVEHYLPNHFGQKVGIGTATPQRQLEVRNASGVGYGLISGTTGAELRFRPNNSYSANGNFGIEVTGTNTNPTYTTTMNFTGYHSGETTVLTLKGNKDVYMQSGGALFLDGGNNTYIQESSADTITIATGGAARLTLNNSHTTVSGILQGGNVFAKGTYCGGSNTSNGFLIETNIITSNYAMMHGTIKLEQFNFNTFQTIEFSVTTNSNGTIITKAGKASTTITIKLFNYNSKWYVWVPQPSSYTTCTAFIGLASSYQGQEESFNEVEDVSHNAVPSSGVSNSTDLICSDAVVSTNLDINGVGNVSGILSVASKLYLEANTSQIQVGANWNTGVLQFLNGPTTAVEFDIPNGRIKNNLGRYLTASGGNNNHFGSFDNYSMSLVTNNTPRLTINNAGNATFTGTVTAATTFIADAVDGTNNDPGADNVRFSGYGMIGNRDQLYITNVGNKLVFGVGGTHNAQNKLIISGSTSAFYNNITSTGTITGTTLTGTSLDINGNGDISGNLVVGGSAHWDLSSGEYSGDPRALVTGYSGSQYGQIGYNVAFNSDGTHQRAFNDIPTRMTFHNGIVLYAGAAGSAGSTISWTEILEAQTDAFQYKGNDIFYNGYAGNATFSGIVDITNSTEATDSTGDTGALRVEGGISSGGHIYGEGLMSQMGRSQIDDENKAYPIGHYTTGKDVFSIDPTWTENQLQELFNNSGVTWATESDAPAGWSILVTGSVGVGNPYGSTFPLIPIDDTAVYFTECWIKNVGTDQTHYMGSAERNEDFANPDTGQGNTGTFGYHVMSNTNPGSSWTRVTGHITGRSATASGNFETDANYFSPLALFNYGAGSGTRACLISGWRITKIDKQEYFADGTAALPSITNYNDTDTGIYWNAANAMSLTTGGTNRLTINSTRALFSAEVEAASLDINGNADISGTTSLHNALTITSGTNAMFTNASASNGKFHQFESYWSTNMAGSTATYRFDVGNWRLWSAGTSAAILSATSAGNFTFAHDVTISGGDLVLGGTGRIQGIDTVTSGTDAVNKTYVDNKFTSTDATGDNYTFEVEDEGNISGNRWYHVSTINNHNGGLHIRGFMANHVEAFGTQKFDLAIACREGGGGDAVEITGQLDVLHNAGSGSDRAGIRVIKTADSSYDEYKVYIRTTRYSMVTLRLTQQGTVTFNTNHSSPLTSEPAGLGVELDTSTTLEGNYVIDDSTIKEIFHEGNLPPSAAKLTDGGDIATDPGTSNLIYTGQISNGTSGLFTASDNSNSIITVNRHTGNYNSQLGFSSNGNLYYRKFSNSDAYTTQAWNQIYHSGNVIPSADLDADTMHLGVNQTVTNHKKFSDDKYITFGDGNDMRIFHDTSGAGPVNRINSAIALKIADQQSASVTIGKEDSSSGAGDATDVVIANKLTVNGDFVAKGEMIIETTTNLAIKDSVITVNDGSTGTPSEGDDIGIMFERGNAGNVFMGWDESIDKFIFVQTDTDAQAATGLPTNGLVYSTEGANMLTLLAGSFQAISGMTIAGNAVYPASTTTSLGTSNTVVPTQNAVKSYVDAKTWNWNDITAGTVPSTILNSNVTSVSGNAGSVTNGVYTTGDQSIGGKKTFTGPTKLEQTLFYDKSAGSLNTTGFACAGLSSGSNGASATFVFECGGGAGNTYQRIVYNCWSVQGTWNTSKSVDEGGNKFDVTASANGSTITFTFKSRSGTQYYTPRVHVQAMGQSIVTTY